MHTKSMNDSDGTFSEWRLAVNRKCPECHDKNTAYRIWTSNCGGYKDCQYHCYVCTHRWWIDGIDA